MIISFYGVTLRLFRTSWRVFTGNIKPDDKWSLAAQNAYSIERDNCWFLIVLQEHSLLAASIQS